MTVNRSIITDLWPAYASGQASRDTRALVEEFFRGDPAFAAQLRGSAKTISRSRLFVRILLVLALVFTFQAFGRIVSDTSWDVSPRNFIAVASVAVAFWTAWIVGLWRARSPRVPSSGVPINS
jgi:hypothetical protein